MAPERRRGLWVGAWALGATILLFPRVFLHGEVLYFRDIFRSYAPMKFVLREALRSGELPVWNSYVFTGVPLLPLPAHSAFYPLNFLLLFDPFPRALTLWIVVHYPLALGSMYFYLRRSLGMSSIAALTGATAYAFSGLALGESSILHQLAFHPWPPLLLAAAHRGTPRPVGTGILWAIAISSGAAERLLFFAPLALLYAGLVGDRRGAIRATLSLLLGVALAGPVWLTALVHLGRGTYRGQEGIPWSMSTIESLSPMRAASLLLPITFDDFAVIAARDYFPLHAWLYLGASTFALSLLSAHHRNSKFWGAVALAAFLLAMGRYGPVWETVWKLAPPVRVFRYPVKFLWFASFPLSVLAAMGVEHAGEIDPRRAVLVAVLALALAAVAGAGLGVGGALPIDIVPQISHAARHAVLFAAATIFSVALACRRGVFGALIPLVVLLDLATTAGTSLPTAPIALYDPPPTAAWISEGRLISSWEWLRGKSADERKGLSPRAIAVRDGLVAEAGAMWGVRTVDGMEDLIPLQIRRILNFEDARSDSGAERLGWLSGRWRLLPRTMKPPPPPWRAVRSDSQTDAVLYENPLFLPRARLQGLGTVRVCSERNGAIDLDVSAETSCPLALADAPAEGGTARVNGGEVPIHSFAGVIRLVEVPRGSSLVTFRYLPPGLWEGLSLTVLGLVLLPFAGDRRIVAVFFRKLRARSSTG